jgi:DNA-binding response OmpR family regulator
MLTIWTEIRNSGIRIEAEEHSFPGAPYRKSNRYTAKEYPEGKTRFKVLIVEDERLIAENLKFILEEKGYQVVGIAASGEEALLVASLQSPDLLLMDIRIQGPMDGIETVKRIRNFYRPDVAVLFLSAFPAERFPHLSHLKADSYRYLRKPYSPGELLSEVHSLTVRQ